MRYLNAVGGGTVRKIEGKIAYVDEDGFETPVLVNELVVVLPAGHDRKPNGPNLMFDQKAFDAGRSEVRGQKSEARGQRSEGGLASGNSNPASGISPLESIEETKYGDKLNIALAFEPTRIRDLSKSDFNAVLVNDSNYFLFFTFLRRSAEERGWHTVYAGEVAPNELVDMAVIKQGEFNDYERVALQYVAFKKGKEFEMKAPASISRKLDLTKFFKLHSFRPGIYFDNPVMEIRLVKDDDMGSGHSDRVASGAILEDQGDGVDLSKLTSSNQPKKKQPKPQNVSPYKLLPLIEVDLHIDQLVDTTTGMDNKAMLQLQLDTVRKTMKENEKRKGQKIVFIHGKGDGVLRKAVRDLLKKEWPKGELQDASFQEYGFGATLVTIHNS